MRTEADRFERAWAARVEGADTVVDSVEFAELLVVAEGLRALANTPSAPPADAAWDRLAQALDRPLVPFRPAVPVAPARGPVPRRRWAPLKWAAAAVTLFVALAGASLRASPGSVLYPLRTGLERTAHFLSPDDTPLHLGIARTQLSDLLHSLRAGPERSAPGLARALMDERDAARRLGDDVSSLDAAIRGLVPPALVGVPPAIAERVRAALAPLLPPAPVRHHAAQPGRTNGSTGPRHEHEHRGRSAGGERGDRHESGDGTNAASEGSRSGSNQDSQGENQGSGASSNRTDGSGDSTQRNSGEQPNSLSSDGAHDGDSKGSGSQH